MEHLPELSTVFFAASTDTNSPSNAMMSPRFGRDDNEGRIEGTADKDCMLNTEDGMLMSTDVHRGEIMSSFEFIKAKKITLG